MSLVQNGRARLALALPRHRGHLRSVKSHELDDLFESYALAAKKLDDLRREVPRQEELILEYQSLCLDMQADVVALLERPNR
ncbi:hypothetical protein BC360_29465 [Ensifer sp. LC163]|nr:hypothetical protein BC361_32755 [Ensifer sp. LC54]OCP17897.1 hypothetical protein BC363_32940 [Ensifer sp. LC384]OCP34924.1 hypothetical protein BC360_29465 [Ensifer sp. LC163]